MANIIHQTGCSQLIPGNNRNDENIEFSHGDKCISQIVDGLSYPEKLIADAFNAQQRGRYTKLWNENLNKIADNNISEAYKGRDKKIHQWKELLNKEVDSLAKEIECIEECDRDVFRKRNYFADLSRASQMTAEYRKRIPDHTSDDEIDILLKQELCNLGKADEDMRQCSNDFKNCGRKLKNARSSLMSEVEAKVMTLNVNRRCQHMEPLLSYPYIPSNHPIDQIYRQNTEEEWAKNLDDKIQNAVDIRREASNARCRAESFMKHHLSCTVDAWHRTSKALIESVQRDERRSHNIQKLLKTVGENISSTNQRIASLHDDLRVQDRGKTLQLWRLQTMTYRPGPDHIRDEPIKKIDEEVSNIEAKHTFISENLKQNKTLVHELMNEKQRITLELEKLSRKLHIERENCIGLRRSQSVESCTSPL
ncbi:tektin-5 [Parasteatoda tepidariorum]|uniref:tektin-5 n=1 Tax=Parasteatoda tepidariorum TaxID=114398 RepID=UPI001C71D699|nr:tektin-5 [Parasteatoda tepidariorum]